jgi:PRTRC genetic system protein A
MMTSYLTDRRDQIVFGETPTLMQSLHGEALPKPETGKHRFVIAGDGVYVEAINPVLEVRLPVAKSSIKLPYGRIGAVGVRLTHGQIPKRILQDVCEKTFLCAEYEWAGLVVWDKIRKEYALYELDTISSSTRHISYRNALPDEYELVMDLHSHGSMPAFFSKTDDKSDIGGFYIAGVVGNCDSGEPTFATRIVVNGHFFECSDFRRYFSKENSDG